MEPLGDQVYNNQRYPDQELPPHIVYGLTNETYTKNILQGFSQPEILDIKQEQPHHHPHRAEIDIYLTSKHEKFIDNIDFKDRDIINASNNPCGLQNKGSGVKDGKHHHSPEVEIYENPELINFKSSEAKDHENWHHHRLEAEIGLKILPFPNTNTSKSKESHEEKYNNKLEDGVFTIKNPCVYKIEKKHIEEGYQRVEVIKNPYRNPTDAISLKEKPHHSHK
ncbi:hypothetical protein SteCoe_10376 [Stentor coeruleus]|uniref:Uncharacterized protein n=1 Tax=Stentor coeruleus TaxID=5963 RepID=A0A1R2CFT2_9CILI|nr:hypothetical protein SteCoe_10376 [Stentor coeruleus]